MVKHHRSTGAPRHFRKNQKKYAAMKNGTFSRSCMNCAHCGRASGDARFGGYAVGSACFNRKSRHYMKKVAWRCCEQYEVSRKNLTIQVETL